MTLKKKNFILMLLSLVFISCSEKNLYQYTYLYKNLAFDMPHIEKPVFPDNEVVLSDFGAVADGVTLNTEAFDKAMTILSEKGGGTLHVPSGVWYTGPITLKSNINLHLEKGALILFSSDYNLYPLVETVFEGLNTHRCQSPISGKNLKNIAITGEGSINGSGEAWRPLKKSKVTEKHWNEVVNSGGVVKDGNYWFPTAGALRGMEMSDMNVPTGNLSPEEWDSVKVFLRPVMVSLIECENILLEGVLFENSPSWNIHPLMCKNLIVDNVFVRNPGYAQNGDGLDIESCTNVIVVNSKFDVGDDAICIKSGKDEDGRKRNRPTENIIVDNCKVFQGHGGFVVGSEMSGGVRNISVSNCQFLGTDVGLRFKSCRGRGGVVENIYVRDINMFNIATEPLLFDLYYGGKSAVEVLEDGDNTSSVSATPKMDETTPTFRNIHINNIVARNARRAMFINGLPENKIENVTVENAVISAAYGAELSEIKGIALKNVEITSSIGAPIILKNTENVDVIKLKYPSTSYPVVQMYGDNKGTSLPATIVEEKIERK